MIVTIVGVIVGPTRAARAVVELRFDPVDFFNYTLHGQERAVFARKTTHVSPLTVYKPLSDGFSTHGGMFMLAKTWGGEMYASWIPEQRSMVDKFVAGLGDGEGIAAFSIWLHAGPNAPLWGERVVWDPAGPAPTGTAPGGWVVDVDANQ